MIENPIYNPTPNTGLKGANPGLKTAQYQMVKIIRMVVKWGEMGVRGLLTLLRDMVKETVRPGSTSKYQ